MPITLNVVSLWFLGSRCAIAGRNRAPYPLNVTGCMPATITMRWWVIALTTQNSTLEILPNRHLRWRTISLTCRLLLYLNMNKPFMAFSWYPMSCREVWELKWKLQLLRFVSHVASSDYFLSNSFQQCLAKWKMKVGNHLFWYACSLGQPHCFLLMT